MQSSILRPFENYLTCPNISPIPMESPTINIPRNPINCPISSCSNSSVFVSDFTKHIKMNHVRVPIEVLNPQCGSNIFIDTSLDEVKHNRCRMLYLVTDKIRFVLILLYNFKEKHLKLKLRDLGSTRYKNYLPVMVMTTRLPLDQFQPTTSSPAPHSESCFMVWLTGLCPTQNPVHITLTVWHRPHKNQPILHRVQSGILYCIRMPQNAVDVFRNGQAIVLTSQQCNNATHGGSKLLKLQVTVH